VSVFGLEGIPGFKRIGNTLQIDLDIPPYWDGFEIRYQFGESTYFIQVSNPDHVSHNTHQILLDGQQRDDFFIPLVDDMKEHRVDVKM
jgi:cyclic beta-1,2-glucan synthetase